MNAEQFADFWSAQGYKIIRTNSCYWYNTESFVYLSLPFHRIVSPDRKELARIFINGPAVVARYACPGEECECNGGLYVVDDKNYDFPSLKEKARNRTRRALKFCQVERVEFSELAKWGYEIDKETYIRQERDPNTLSQEKWARYCDSASRIEGFEAWGAFVDGTPVAYVVCALIEDYYHILKQSSATDYLSYCPNNALTFTITQQAIAHREVRYVSIGLKSIEDTSGLNRYKEGMGYVLKPFRDRVVINPAVRILFAAGGARLVKKLHERNPGVDFWRKAVRIIEQEYENG